MTTQTFFIQAAQRKWLRRIGLLAALCLLLVTALTGQAGAQDQLQDNSRVIYVNHAATGANTGASWANAYTSLLDALDNATSGDEIWVAQGLYTPTLDRRSFEIPNGVALYGGFSGGESSRDQRDWEVHVTLLSGDLERNDLAQIPTQQSDLQGDNSIHVVQIIGRDDERTRLDGFTVTAGSQGEGAGVRIDNGSRVTLENVRMTGNFAGGADGGGLAVIRSEAMLINICVINNRGARGGGITISQESTAVLIDGLIQENISLNNGGGLQSADSTVTVINTRFLGNDSDGEGGGMNNGNSVVGVVNALFVGNIANFGGAVTNVNGDDVTLINSTFVQNQARESGQVFYNFASAPTIYNSILWENGTGDPFNGQPGLMDYSIVQGAGAGQGSNNLDGTDPANAPQFVRMPNLAQGDYGDLRPTATSPMIDRGSLAQLPNDAYDLNGNGNTDEPLPYDLVHNPRVTGDTVDLGAYEYAPVQIFLPLTIVN